MTENIVSKKIRQHGADGSVVFVFPSDVAANLWLEAALDLTGAGTIPSSRFVAWDRFKEEAVQATVAGKSPVSSVIRKMYALDLVKRNAVSPLFGELIPREHSSEGAIFAPWIARILPQLEIWERKSAKSRGAERGGNGAGYLGTAGGISRNPESQDLAALKDDYARFLEGHKLFEPSWQRPPLRDTGKRYVIFFPEAIEDYSEYAALLGPAKFVETVPVPPRDGEPADGELPLFDVPAELYSYENSRHEISALAIETEKLLRAGTAPERIAVSVPDLETVEPYLVREFSLRGIPFEYRAGFPLGTLPAGRLFSLVADCVSSGFSFASMKAILLDRVVPWKNRDMTAGLVAFGIRNHCVSSWSENGKTVDVWEEAFRAPTVGEASDWRLAEFWRALSRAMRQMTAAESFSEIRKQYFAFREKFLDMETLAAEDDAVLARCVEELNALSALEGRYGPYVPSRAFDFFASTLAEKKYVAQRAHGGVSVFPYRVAAGTPYDWHFVIDASQDSATVVYSQLAFLRQDRRRALNLLDTDASDAFFSIYRECGARFSVAERSFTGYRTPHGFFRNVVRASPAEAGSADGRDCPGTAATQKGDPYSQEREWFAAGIDSDFPNRVYPAQKDGVIAWAASCAPKGFSYLREPFGESLAQLNRRIADRQMNGCDVRVTQTDLALFSDCGARWFLSRMLAIKSETADAELLNERNLGILYHDVLKRLYESIRVSDGAFNAQHLEDYKMTAKSLVESAAAMHAEFRGPIAEPLIESLVKRITDGVAGILDRDAETLDGFIPEFLEDDIAFSEDGIRYYGKIDRISRRPSDSMTVLIDYKSGKVPSPGVYKADEANEISDFQIPMYVHLAENSPGSPYEGKKIEFAWFAGIQDGDWRPIINDNEEIRHGQKRGMVTREEFEPAMGSFRKASKRFEGAVRAREFVRPDGLPASECFSCDYQKICRYTYAVRPR